MENRGQEETPGNPLKSTPSEKASEEKIPVENTNDTSAKKESNNIDEGEKTTYTSTVNVEKIQDGVQNFAQSINQTININENNIRNAFLEEISSSSIRFSKNILRTIETDDEKELLDLKKHLEDSAFIEEAYEKLLAEGIIIISGHNKLPLTQLGILIGEEVRKKGVTKETMYSESIGKQVRINFQSDIGSAKESFGEAVLVFNNPLRKQNFDFTELIDDLVQRDSLGYSKKFVQQIKGNKTFIILIIEGELTVIDKKIISSPFHIEAPYPSIEQRRAFFNLKVTDILDANKLSTSQVEFAKKMVNEDNRESLLVLEGLRFFVDITSFTDQLASQFINDPSWIPTYEDIKDLIRKSRDLNVWLIDELGKDLKLWSFTLSLGLLHNTPYAGDFGISIIEFELFRKRLEEFLRSEQRVKREVKEWQSIASEENLFIRCKAQKNRNPEDGKLYIGFKEDHIAEEIWQSLLLNLSLSVVNTIPFLLNLIDEKFQAANSARILGRLGEIDPGQALSWISTWSNSDDERHRVMVGYLFQGIHASGKKSYIERCEQLLEKYSLSGSYEQIWTSVAAFKQIGLYQLDYALERIGIIVEKKIAPPYEEISSLQARQSWNFNKLQIFTSIRLKELEELIGQTSELQQKVKELENHEQIFRAISYSISALCIMLEPLSVITEWKKWLEKENTTLKILFVKMLIPNGGVLDQLDRQVSFYNEQEKQYQDWHYMVLVISYGEKASNILVDLLIQVTDIFPLLQTKESRTMEDLLVKYLTNWVEASMKTPKAKDEIIEFLGKVLANVQRLHEAFQNQIKAWQEDESLRYKTLAVNLENARQKELSVLKEKRKVDVSGWNI